jgi:hypothetical protein
MPGSVSNPIIIRGLSELNRAFARAGKQTRHEIRFEMAALAEPVRQTAERLAVEKIRNIGLEWSQMRTGVTSRLVYVAPVQRGVKTRGRDKRRRPNLAELLIGRALDPALAINRAHIEAGFERMLDRISDSWASNEVLEIDPRFRG